MCSVEREQRASHSGDWQTSLHNPDFAAFAELCGAKGIRVTSPEEIDGAPRAGLDHPGRALVEVVTDALLV